jgi:hypothetical protein
MLAEVLLWKMEASRASVGRQPHECLEARPGLAAPYDFGARKKARTEVPSFVPMVRLLSFDPLALAPLAPRPAGAEMVAQW